MPFWLILLLVGVALTFVAYLLAPRPKAPRHEARDLEAPTADAGRPVPILFGTVTIKGLNVLWYGQKRVRTEEREV
jgi:hypothetical protein